VPTRSLSNRDRFLGRPDQAALVHVRSAIHAGKNALDSDHGSCRLASSSGQTTTIFPMSRLLEINCRSPFWGRSVIWPGSEGRTGVGDQPEPSDDRDVPRGVGRYAAGGGVGRWRVCGAAFARK